MQNNPNMSNMGWESGAAAAGAPAGAMTPGHHSMGAPTPYRSEIDEVRILAMVTLFTPLVMAWIMVSWMKQTTKCKYFPFPFKEEEYANPASVKSNQAEEEMKEDETIEEFEDRVLNKRAAHLNTILK